MGIEANQKASFETFEDDGLDFSTASTTLEDDGSVTIELEPDAETLEVERLAELEEAGHFDNLAPLLDQDDVQALGDTLMDEVNADYQSKEEWEQTYKDGLRLMGIRVEEDNADPGVKPFEGSSDEVHPVLTEAVIRFQAQAYKELIPGNGPVSTKVIGLETPERLQQAGRVKEYLNYLMMQKMPEFESDFDQMLLLLPLAGSQFRKTSYDVTRKRPVDVAILAENFAVNPDATDLITSRRASMRTVMSIDQITAMQQAGVWQIPEQPIIAGDHEQTDIEEAYDDITGINTSVVMGETVTIYECHIQGIIEEIDSTAALPYIVTMAEGGQVLAISRNWDESDEQRVKREYFTHFKFMPGIGFYGMGYVHILGQLARGSTSLLRQLIDAGVLANLPAGFKARGFRVDRENEPLTPGEWREVDTMDQPISNMLYALPYQEPSSTLLALMQELVASAQRLASMTDMSVGDGNSEAPVGTTVALLERTNMTQSAIHKRLYCSMKQELSILARTVKENMPEGGYPYEVVGEGSPQELMQADFDDRIDIIPVADPDMFSMSQRIALAQTRLQMAQQAPQLHDLRAAYQAMYQAMNVKDIDQILPPPEKMKPKDPLTETMEAMQGKPVKAFIEQDHQSHIAMHVSVMQNPQYADNVEMIQAMQAHIQEHQAMHLRVQIQQSIGQPLPENLADLPPAEAAQIAAQIAQATQQVTGQAQALAEAQEAAQQPDVQERIAAVQEAEVQRKVIKDRMDNDLETAKTSETLDLKEEKQGTDAMLALAKLESATRNNDATNAVTLTVSELRHDLDANAQVADNMRLLHDLKKPADDDDKAKSEDVADTAEDDDNGE